MQGSTYREPGGPWMRGRGRGGGGGGGPGRPGVRVPRPGASRGDGRHQPILPQVSGSHQAHQTLVYSSLSGTC